MRRSSRNPRLDLCEAIHLEDDPIDPRRNSATHRLAHAARYRDMIVLDHRRIVEPHPVVGCTTHPRRILLQHAKAGNGLARVEQRRAGPGNGIDIGARHRRDARQMLHCVERRTFGGEDGAGIAAEPHQISPGGHARALGHQYLDVHRRIEHSEERLGNRQSGDDDRIAAVHYAGETRLSGDDGSGGNIATLAHILGQRGGDEGTEIESGKLKCHGSALSIRCAVAKPRLAVRVIAQADKGA